MQEGSNEGRVGAREENLEVIAEVVDSASGAGSGEVIVEPSEKNILRGKLEETRHVFALLQQDHQLRMVLQRDLREELDLDDLPKQPEDEDWAVMERSEEQIIAGRVTNRPSMRS
jgi:hypothetical protein